VVNIGKAGCCVLLSAAVCCKVLGVSRCRSLCGRQGDRCVAVWQRDSNGRVITGSCCAERMN